jgi:hypothetical protein
MHVSGGGGRFRVDDAFPPPRHFYRYPAEIPQRLDNSHRHEIERVNDRRFVLGFIANELNHIAASPTP